MKKNKGFTVVELIASFALTMVITVFLFEVLIEVKDIFTDTSTKTAIQQKASIISKNVESLLKVVENKIVCSDNTCDVDGKYIIINSENEILINNQTFKMPDTVSIKNYNLTSDCTLNNDCYLYIKMDLTSGNLNKDYNYDTTYYYKPLNDDTQPGVGKNQVTYDIDTNEGTSVEINNKYYKENENIDLSVTAIKNGWEFVGWNTDANAKEALSGSYPMPNHDITLYAIFSKEVKATFTKGSNVTSIGKTSSTCKMYNKASSCEITLPSITANSGYVSDGWYKSSTKIGEANTKYNINANTSLEARSKVETVDLSISTTSTSSSISVTATASAASGIKNYQFCINGGSCKTQTSNSYTFTGLSSSTTYNVSVKATSNADNTKTVSKNVTTSAINLTAPTFTETYNGEVKITFPSGCSGGITCSYSKNGGSYVTVSSGTTVYFGSDGDLVAKVSSEASSKSSSYTVIRDDLYASSSGSDTSGYGTKNKPYASVGKCYTSATTVRTATINVMNTVTQSSTINMSSSKDIILTSYTSTQTVKRGSSVTGYLINQTSGSLTLDGIIIDGNSVSASSPMIRVAKKVTMESGTTLKNAVTRSDYGGAVQVYSGTFTMNGGTISNNSSTYNNRGGAGVYVSSGGTFTMNSGTISSNKGYNGAGVWNNGTFTMYGGSITSNTATAYNAGVDSSGKFNLRGGSITGNSAPIGGGIGITDYNGKKGRLNIYGGTINNNSITKSTQKETTNINVVEGCYVYESASGYSYTQGQKNYIVNYKATGSGLAVDGAATANNTNIVFWQNSGNNQKWRTYLTKIISGKAYYSFAVYHTSDRWLWIQNNSTSAGANVIIYSMNTNNGGYWNLKSAGSGYYYFKNIGGLCLDLYNNQTANGTKIDAYTCNNQANQKWKFVSTS